MANGCHSYSPFTSRLYLVLMSMNNMDDSFRDDKDIVPPYLTVVLCVYSNSSLVIIRHCHYRWALDTVFGVHTLYVNAKCNLIVGVWIDQHIQSI